MKIRTLKKEVTKPEFLENFEYLCKYYTDKNNTEIDIKYQAKCELKYPWKNFSIEDIGNYLDIENCSYHLIGKKITCIVFHGKVK